MMELKNVEMEKKLNEYKNITTEMQAEICSLKEQLIGSNKIIKNVPKNLSIPINKTQEKFVKLNEKKTTTERKSLTDIFNSW